MSIYYATVNPTLIQGKCSAARFTTHYHTFHVFNVLSTFKHYFTQNMMFSSVNTYNFHSNVKEIKKISVNLLFRQRVMASMIFTHRDNPKLLSDHVLTIFRSSYGSGGGWGAFSFYMVKIFYVILYPEVSFLLRSNTSVNTHFTRFL